jgi:hypothetical protein
MVAIRDLNFLDLLHVNLRYTDQSLKFITTKGG